MRIGAVVGQLPSLEATLDEFDRLEGVGLESAWYSQPPDGFDASTVLALAAARTRRLRLGTAVVPTFPRHPLVAVSFARTIAALAPGRLVLGVSPGHRVWVEGQYGLRFADPLAHARQWVLTVRRLLAGEAVDPGDNDFGVAATAHPDGACAVPVALAATGPHLLSVAGEVADAVLTWLGDRDRIESIVVPAVTAGARRANRPIPPIIAGVLVCVTDNPQDARGALGPRLSPLGVYASYRAVLGGDREPIDVALIGSEDDVRDGLAELARIGVAEVAAVVLPDPSVPADSVHRAHRVLAEVGKASRLPSTP